MATIDEVLGQLQPEETPAEINFNAPEPGAFAPAFVPGKQSFRFTLPDANQFEIAEIQGKKYLQVNFNAVVDVGGTERSINFQRATTFKTDKMNNHKVGDLIRSLELQEVYEATRQETGDFNTAIVRTLQQASGRAVGYADFGWTAAFKDSLTIFRTSASKTVPPKKQGGYTTKPWPRTADGGYVATVADPATGQEKYPNLEINRFLIARPTATEQATSSTVAA